MQRIQSTIEVLKNKNIILSMVAFDEVHLNSYVHRIVEILKKEDRAFGTKEISSMVSLNIMNNSRLVDILKKNPRIEFRDDSLRFVPIYNIRSIDELRKILRECNCREGIEKAKLTESPVDILPFINELREQGDIIILQDMDGSEIVFYNDMQVEPADEKIRELWDSVKVPNYHDILEELNSVGLQNSSSLTLKKNKTSRKKATKRSRRRIRVTNTHVKGLDLHGINDSE